MQRHTEKMNSVLSRVSRAGVAGAAAVAMFSSVMVPVALAGVAPEECPAVVVLAARGSDQNEEYGEYFGPQRYSDASQPSNGHEGPNISALLHQVEQRHPGTMDDVYVRALDPEEYPASMDLPAIAEEGENLNPLQVLQRLGEILRDYPLGDLVYSVTLGVVDSLRTGVASAPRVVAEYEQSTGCSPQYVLAGYSQGALVTASIEKQLAQEGKLAGVITMGNPVGQLPWRSWQGELPPERRVDYCLEGDVVCDFSLQAASDALATKMETHASYFLGEPTANDVVVIDAVAGILSAHD